MFVIFSPIDLKHLWRLDISLPAHLRDQLSRAASSIALNLSEGNAKRSEKEEKRYYQTTCGSCQEGKRILRLAKLHELLIAKNLDHLAASIYKLMNARIVTIRRRAQDSDF